MQRFEDTPDANAWPAAAGSCLCTSLRCTAPPRAVAERSLKRVSMPVFCHPERSEGGHARFGPLHFVQGDTGGSENTLRPAPARRLHCAGQAARRVPRWNPSSCQALAMGRPGQSSLRQSRANRSVSASAGKNASIRSSWAVMSRGAPTVVTIEKKLSRSASFRNSTG
jgi:hypothetical protein